MFLLNIKIFLRSLYLFVSFKSPEYRFFFPICNVNIYPQACANNSFVWLPSTALNFPFPSFGFIEERLGNRERKKKEKKFLSPSFILYRIFYIPYNTVKILCFFPHWNSFEYIKITQVLFIKDVITKYLKFFFKSTT